MRAVSTLTALTALLAALGAVAILGIPAPPRAVCWATSGVSALGAVLLAVTLAAGTPSGSAVLPIGLPGAAVELALDGLSAYFAMVVLLVGAVVAAAATDLHLEPEAVPLLPAFLAAMVFTVLAADGFALALGFETMSLLSFGLVLAAHRDARVRGAALLYLGMSAFGALLLVAAAAMLAHPAEWGLDIGFAAIRAHPPGTALAALALAVVLLGAGSKAGLFPLHFWLPPAHAAAPSPVSALLSGAMTKVAVYILIRFAFDLCGTALPGWMAAAFLVLGAAGAALGGIRAATEPDAKVTLGCSTVENIGIVAIGLGVALAARAADLGTLAALALSAALLHVLAHALFKPLLFLGVGEAQHAAGTSRLDLAGGLIHRMPVTTTLVLVGAAAWAALPPTASFASEWLLFQSLLAAPRAGGIAMQALLAVSAVLLALAAALAAAGAVRLVGVMFLGRPRSPRAAVAEEHRNATRWAMLALAGGIGFVGLFPAAPLALIDPALQMLLGAGAEGRFGVLAVAPQPRAPGYVPLAVLLLLSLGLLTLIALMLRRPRGHSVGPAWGCGFGPAPPWLPFGDPLAQYGASGFGQPLRRILGAATLGSREFVRMPPPGSPMAARLTVRGKDPAVRLILGPARQARRALSVRADGLQFLTVRRSLLVMFLALVAMLAVVAALERL